jgi:heavy metal translocating P-type ATPase
LQPKTLSDAKPADAPDPNPVALVWLWLRKRRSVIIAALALAAIALHLALRFIWHVRPAVNQVPLLVMLAAGGLPLLMDLLRKLVKLDFGADLLGGISIVISLLLGEYLAGTVIVLMLAGGEAIQSYALASASSVLAALAKRMPSVAHRKNAGSASGADIEDVALSQVVVGDLLVVYPHDICPVDGVVTDGHGVMDESFLTGEPFEMTKTCGSKVISGAVNGDTALTIRTTKIAADSRQARIMEVMKDSEAQRPQLRRLGDQLGAFYTPLALAVAAIAWAVSGDATRFLAVLVIATPCPLLIAIPVAIIGSISLCARRAIIVRNPVALEQISQCRTAIFDKTGTLTYGAPTLTDQLVAADFNQTDVLAAVASLERYSKHPLARAILTAAKTQNLPLTDALEVSEPAGQGMRGSVAGRQVRVTSRDHATSEKFAGTDALPPVSEGLECVVVIDERYAATYRFHDAPRTESKSFVSHLGPMHQFDKLMIISGDRESEVHYLAALVGITDIHAQQSPEQKLALVRQETAAAKTLYVGDGINDAPAMMAATVGIALGQSSDVTAQAAAVVVMDNSLKKVDEFMHISRHMRKVALQSAIGGMALSLVGMGFAATGQLDPVLGAVLQEGIDVLAILNALRAAFPPKVLEDV